MIPRRLLGQRQGINLDTRAAGTIPALALQPDHQNAATSTYKLMMQFVVVDLAGAVRSDRGGQ
jgi:hypothetical protein